MGKKKRQNQNSNNSTFTTVDSSESESSKDSTQPIEGTKPLCAHYNKSVELTNVRKHVKNNRDKKNPITVCVHCKRNDSYLCKDAWVCMRCGSCSCGPDDEDHRTHHYKIQRSDTHFLAFQLNTNIIWCFKCEREIPIDVTKKVQGCVDFIKKQYNDHLPFNPVRLDTDNKNMNEETVNYLKEDTLICQPLKNVCLNKEVAKPNLPKVRGLSNLGNTCFFNSVLQCLAQTPGLVELLREMDVPGEKFHLELEGITIDTVLEKHKTSVMSEYLAQILTEVSGVRPTGAGDNNFKSWQYAVNPRRLLDALTNKCPQFEGGDQHDAHELLRHLLDTVHMEDLRRYQKAILDHIGYSNSLDNVDEDKKKFGKKLNQKVCDTIPIRPDQIFKGSLVSILQCTVCLDISKREETFLDLSLPVAQERAQPPPRRKQNCSSPEEEKQTTEVRPTKHYRKNKNMSTYNRRIRLIEKRYENKEDQAQGEPTIEEEDKKDSLDGEQSDADVEDNACEEQDHKTEIVESGYSSEKQMSARGSPVTTQSLEEESKCNFKPGVPEYPVVQGCEINPDHTKPLTDMLGYYEDPESLLAKRAESGLGSIQELTVTIPEEASIECTSQDSVRVNTSNGSPDISSDSQHSNFKTVDLSSIDFKQPPISEVDRSTIVYNWNCSEAKCSSQDSSSVSLSVSPQNGSLSSQDNINQVSPKGSPLSGSHTNDNMSISTSLPHSNDNMSVCNNLPENVSMILNSPVKSQNSNREENSGSEERPESRMECRKNRSSPVEPGELPELDSGLLKLSLEGMACVSDGAEGRTSPITLESRDRPAEPVYNPEDQNGFVLIGGVMPPKSPIPLPPPLPLFETQYSYSHPESSVQRYKYKSEEGEFSLDSCLSQFTTIEMLAGGNKVGCKACTERLNKGNKEGKTVYQNSTKQLLICKLPPVIIFHLKRFQVQRCSFRKITRHVVFPLVLDMSPFCSVNEEDKPSEQILYSLYGVVEHSGTLHGGHYVACVKVRSHSDCSPGMPPHGKWYYVSDSHVSDVDESFVLQRQAYLLFYERIL